MLKKKAFNIPLRCQRLVLRAEDGAQTRDPQLGRLMLYQLSYFRNKIFDYIAALSGCTRHNQNKFCFCSRLHDNSAVFKDLWAKMDSNHRRRTPADLQSAPFGHSGICPNLVCYPLEEVCGCKVTTIFLNCKRFYHFYCSFCTLAAFISQLTPSPFLGLQHVVGG